MACCRGGPAATSPRRARGRTGSVSGTGGPAPSTSPTIRVTASSTTPKQSASAKWLGQWSSGFRRKWRWGGEVPTSEGSQGNISRDCHNTKGEKDMCVVGAINNYTAALKDSSSPYDRTESLMFLAHFVGDVHQPLHCGRADDLGGNTIIVHWYRRKSNLHHVWDVNVIQTAMKDFYGNDLSTMIQAIQRNISGEWANEEKRWETCRSRTKTCADKYAEESAKLACKAYEGVEQGSTLKDDYFFAALPVVQKRIAQGGVRLAAILNNIFGGNSKLDVRRNVKRNQ
ncbi:endonuclease 2-like isoform X3 [Panicum virgatum]|uniref:endonuclease 2-like isoform X3 n=1 Tax=Panicum virgatum TaxID=38727 RepID=UPI0019D6457A|nr:endonuclease 2-like isoform X3 [Panicum virgatum]XP_039774314.1 endonuclease 2-like isoform X3 [Panicum virgatum]